MRPKARKAGGLPERLVKVRNQLGLTQVQMALRLGIPLKTYAVTENGGRAMTDGELAVLADLGISLNWLLTGRDEAVPTAQPEPLTRPSTDPALLGRVIDGVVSVYKGEGQRLAPLNQGQVVGAIYDRLAAIDDEAERRGALRYALDQLRDELKRAAAEPTSGKRQA